MKSLTSLRTAIGVAVLVAGWFPTTALADKVNYDFRLPDQFSGLKTFAFRDEPALDSVAEKTTTYSSPLMDERTKTAIAAQLERRGMTQDDEHPDAYVTTRRSFTTQYVLYGSGWGPYAWGPYAWGASGYAWGPGYNWGGWSGWAPWYAEQNIVETLTVDLVQATTGNLIWRGIGVKSVHQNAKPERLAERLNEQVSDIFKKFPSTVIVARLNR